VGGDSGVPLPVALSLEQRSPAGERRSRGRHQSDPGLAGHERARHEPEGRSRTDAARPLGRNPNPLWCIWSPGAPKLVPGRYVRSFYILVRSLRRSTYTSKSPGGVFLYFR